jgi:hypothetical protein
VLKNGHISEAAKPTLMTHICHPTTKLAVMHSSDVTDRISGVVNGIDAGSD